MKKRVIAMMTAMVMGTALTACGGSGKGAGASSGGEGYTFTSGSAVVEMNADASALLKDLTRSTVIRDSSSRPIR